MTGLGGASGYYGTVGKPKTREETDDELLERLFYVAGKTERLVQELEGIYQLSDSQRKAALDTIVDRYGLKRRTITTNL